MSDAKYPVFRFKKWQFVIGPRFWVAVGVAAVIIAIGFLSSPTNPGVGVLVAVGTLLGTVLGVLLQVVPIPEDHSGKAAAALRGLSSIRDAIGDMSTMVDQIAGSTSEQRTKAGLVAVQQNLIRSSGEVSHSMLDWDRLAPGSLESFVEERDIGRRTLARLSKDLEENA